MFHFFKLSLLPTVQEIWQWWVLAAEILQTGEGMMRGGTKADFNKEKSKIDPVIKVKIFRSIPKGYI